MHAPHGMGARFVVLVLLLAALPARLGAQATRAVFPSTTHAVRSSEEVAPRSLVVLPDSVVYPATYWKEGLLIVGGLTGLLGAAFAGGFCASGEGGGEDCGIKAIGGFVFLGGTGGTIGALIGGSIPKAGRDSASAR